MSPNLGHRPSAGGAARRASRRRVRYRAVGLAIAWLAVLALPLRAEDSSQPRRPVMASRDVSPVVTCLAIDPTNQWLACGGDDELVRIWRVGESKPHFILKGHTDWVQAVVFDAAGQTLYSGGHDGQVLAWRVSDGHPLPAVHTQKTAISDLTMHRSEGRLCLVGFDAPLAILTPGQPASMETRACPTRDMRCVAISPDQKLLAAGGRNGDILVWSFGEAKPRHRIQGHDQRLRCLEFTSDSKHLISGGEDRALCVWDMESGAETRHLAKSTGRIFSLTILAGDRFAAGTTDNRIDVWNWRTGALEQVIRTHQGSVAALVTAGDELISAGFDATIRTWRVDAHGKYVANQRLSVTEEGTLRR